MQAQRITNMDNSSNFGMAIKITPKGKQLLEKHLTPKASKELKALIELEKTNPIDVQIGTGIQHLTTAHVIPKMDITYDSILVTVENKPFREGLINIFSRSKAIISAIKKGVKYAQELTQKRGI